MRLEDRLKAEAAERAQRLAMFDPSGCVSCGTAGSPDGGERLSPVQFLWRKQVGRSAEIHTRVEHISEHPMCRGCWEELRRRRRWFWPIRYAGGFGLAAGICGIVTVPVLLYSMKLNPPERRYMIAVGIVAAVLLPLGLFALNAARRFSVPPPLLEMTRNSWECITVGAIDF